jgi:arsenite-transporting ATPase
VKNTLQPTFLKIGPLKLVFFGGKGGVGKSTCATACALKLAMEYPHEQFLLISTDPAHSLKNILSDVALPKNLDVRELDAKQSLHDFKILHDAALKEIAERGTFLDKTDIQGLMDSALPGMDELAAYFDIAKWLKDDHYARILIDTAPTGHTLRLLNMPELIRRWLIALDTLLAKNRYIRAHFAKNKQLDHLDVFLLDMNDALNTVSTLLQDENRCHFVLVTLAQEMIVEESIDLANALHKQKIVLSDLVINQLVPASDCQICTDARHRQFQALQKLNQKLPNTLCWTLPLLAKEPRNDAILMFLNVLSPLDKTVDLPKVSHLNALSSHIENRLPLPGKDTRLLLFAGKGGVGKTTLACSTALQLQASYPDLNILLFSTDPAHSISDCLGLPISSTPSRVVLNLDAQEINAEAGFDKIRQGYRDELQAFLEENLPNFDITFDREVLERLLDLAPTGLDEIMALTTIMDHLDAGRYDMIVVDAAPSGHFLRLLEMPELIRDWLRLFFSLLLKYRKIMRFPHLSERLVKLSRELKNLRVLLQSAKQTAVYAVTIPTQLALDKTHEMTTALTHLNIHINALIINQITQSNDCQLCFAIASRESAQILDAHDKVTDFPIALVYRHSGLANLNQLAQLGSALYQPIS